MMGMGAKEMPAAEGDAPIIKPSGLNTAVRWLKDHGIKSSRLASLLPIKSHNYVRVLNHRGKYPLSFNPPGLLETVLARPTQALRKRLGVRLEEDSLQLSGKQEKRIEDLEAEIDSVWNRYAQTGNFLDGLPVLQGYEMLRGRPSAAKWFRFMARLHQHRAWFRVHCGKSTSAFQEAKIRNRPLPSCIPRKAGSNRSAPND